MAIRRRCKGPTARWQHPRTARTEAMARMEAMDHTEATARTEAMARTEVTGAGSGVDDLDVPT